MKLPPFYPILDTAIIEAHGFAPIPAAQALLNAGARILQYRHKREFTQARFDEAAAIREICRAAGAVFVMNDRADFASLLDAGLHIGQEDLPPYAARMVLGGSGDIGLSTHNEAQLRAADTEPVDYVALGPIFATGSKQNPDAVLGADALRRWRWLTRKPLVAIGGITLDNASDVLAAGADAIAVISGLLPEKPDLSALEERTRQWLVAARN